MLLVIWLNDSASSPELVPGVDADAVREVALPDALGADEQLVDRARDRSRQRQAHDQRHELDDQEQHGDNKQEEPEGVAERDRAELHRLRVREPLEELPHPERERNRRPKRLARCPVGTKSKRLTVLRKSEKLFDVPLDVRPAVMSTVPSRSAC